MCNMLSIKAVLSFNIHICQKLVMGAENFFLAIFGCYEIVGIWLDNKFMDIKNNAMT